jgi:hypothetical protein
MVGDLSFPPPHFDSRLTYCSLVAFTRAQALLIVVGDAEVLAKDEVWLTFLNYVESCKGWTGINQNWKPEMDHVPGYKMVPRTEGIAYGEEFIGGKSEKIYRSSEDSGA